jgi:hypothetical protein
MTEDECVVRGKWPREGSMGASGDDRFLTLPGVQRICDGCLRSFWYRIVEQAAFTEELVGLENRDHDSLPCSDTRVSRTGGVEGEVLVALPAPHPPNISVRSRSKKRLPLLRGSSTEAAAGQFKVSRDTRGISADNNIEERAMTTY